MEKEGEYSDLIESTEKQAFRIQIPYPLRFAIIWTIFFSLIGLIIQIIQTPKFSFIASFSNFFGSNFFVWLKSFGSFVSTTEYNGGMQVFTSIMSQWYYFLYTAGLIVILWGIIRWLINIRVISKKIKNKNTISEYPELASPLALGALIQKSKKSSQSGQSEEDTDKISNWLEEGSILLDMGKIKEAEAVYAKLQTHYNTLDDPERREYKRILDFYYDIMARKK